MHNNIKNYILVLLYFSILATNIFANNETYLSCSLNEVVSYENGKFYQQKIDYRKAKTLKKIDLPVVIKDIAIIFDSSSEIDYDYSSDGIDVYRFYWKPLRFGETKTEDIEYITYYAYDKKTNNINKTKIETISGREIYRSIELYKCTTRNQTLGEKYQKIEKFVNKLW